MSRLFATGVRPKGETQSAVNSSGKTLSRKLKCETLSISSLSFIRTFGEDQKPTTRGLHRRKRKEKSLQQLFV